MTGPRPLPLACLLRCRSSVSVVWLRGHTTHAVKRLATFVPRMLARTILQLAKKNKGVTGSTAPPVHRVGGDAGSSPATSTDPEDWDVEYYDFSFFQPVCVCCGRIVLSGGFGFERDGMLHYSCSTCEGRVH